MPRVEFVLRILVVFCSLLSLFPPTPLAASSFRRPNYQTEEPATTPTTAATATETVVPSAEPSSATNTPEAVPTETASISPTDPSILTPTAPLPPEAQTTTPPTTATPLATPVPSSPATVELNQTQSSGFQIYLPLIFKVDGPQAAFTANPIIGPVPLTVTFVNSSTYATSHLWDFGDGVSSTAISPTHLYSQAGVYSVTLIVSDGVVSDTLTKGHYITPLRLLPPDVQTDDPLGLLSVFPSTSGLDSFNRSDGALGSNWSGATWGYILASNQLHNEGGGSLYWHAATFGADQEVYVTLTTVEQAASEQDLLLKAQSSSDWSDGLIEVLYDVGGQRVQVWTYTAAQDWVQRGADIPVTFANGDQFGARATASGQVEVYRNGTLLATRDVTGWTYYANGGYIGLWFIDADSSVLDDFGGGTASTGPVSNFSASPLIGTAALTVTFTNSSTNATSYGWNFGDNITSTVISPTHTYTQAGVYSVTLSAGNGTMTHTLTRTNYITVANPVLANFSATPLTGTKPLTVSFSNSSMGATTFGWKFGDSLTSTVISPTHSYTQAGVYSVTLSASNGTVTNTLTRTNYITVSDSVLANFSATPLTGTKPLTVSFSNSSMGATTFGWKFGDSLTSTVISPTHTYTQAGVYTVTLSASNGTVTHTLTRTNYITVANPVLANFSATPLTGTKPLTVSFSNSSMGATTFGWKFGDSLTSTVISPTHTYTQAGVYSVTLSASNGTVTHTLTRTNYITVANPVLANFSATPLTGTKPLTVSFSNSSMGATTFGWKFGDSLTSTVISPTHTYTQAGVYTVTLSASNGTVTHTLTRTNYITVANPVLANFSATPLTGTKPLTVSFSNSSMGATTFGWKFGDSLTSTVISPTHSYTQAGVYTVTLSASNGTVTHTLTRTNYITVANPSPIANFSATPLSGTVPLTVTFTNSSTNASSYGWKYGNGITSTATTVTHTYAYTQPGVYTVTLTATGVGGSASLTKTNYITISNSAPVVSFSASPLTGLAPLMVTFSNSSTHTSSYRWSYGTGSISTTAAVTHTYAYTQPGVYTVTLAASNGTVTHTLTRTNYITVANSSPIANFSATPLSGTIPLTITFANSSTNATAYLWNFGDSITDTVISPAHTYTEAGVYTVTLTATGSGGSNILTRTNYITVSAPTVADFLATPLTGTMPLTVTFVNSSTHATTFGWDFGDHTTSTIVSPTHIYTQVGVYTVILGASNGIVTATVTRTNYITVTVPITREWQLITPTISPPISGEHSLAYDSARNRVVLYGGNATGWPYESATWEFDGADWSVVTTTLSPAARYGAGLAYDSIRQVTVLFGGSDETDTALNQTWEYTHTNWTLVSITSTVPASRTYHSLATNPISGTIYLFGGNDEETYYGDLWHYSSDNGTWSEISVSGDSPPARTLAALTYDTSNNRLLLFGGRSVTGTLLADLWAFDSISEAWQELDDGGGGPPARMAHTLTYDAATGNVVLVGGVTDEADTLLGDTWHYRNQTGWTEADPTTVLPARAYHQAVYDNNNTIILFGNEETWRYE